MRARPRSLLRTLADAAVFLSLLAMVLLALQKAGWLMPEEGRFTAIDGDSLRKGDSEYRLHAIDAPELHQICTSSGGSQYPCGREAQRALRNLVSGQTLSCRIVETDRYGRLVATCEALGLDINEELVRQGWAVAYRAHGMDYAAAELEARKAHRGIWQGRFQTPEDWRAEHRDKIVRGSVAGDGVEVD